VHCKQTMIFELFWLGQIRWYIGFNRWPLPSPRTRCVIKLQIFFKVCNYLPNLFQYYYVWFSQILSQLLQSMLKVWAYSLFRHQVMVLKSGCVWRTLFANPVMQYIITCTYVNGFVKGSFTRMQFISFNSS